MLDGTTVVVIIGFGAVAVAALVIGIRVFSVNEGIERSIGAGLALFGGSVGVLGGSIVAMRLDRWDLAGPLTRWWFLPSEGSLGALGSFLASPSMALLVAAVLCFFAPVTFEVDKGTSAAEAGWLRAKAAGAIVVGLIGGCAGVLADSGILAAVFTVLGIAVGVTAVSLIEHFFRRSPRDADRPRRRRRRAPTRTQTPIEPAEISTGSITEGGSTTG